jgi:hypothetical protein
MGPGLRSAARALQQHQRAAGGAAALLGAAALVGVLLGRRRGGRGGGGGPRGGRPHLHPALAVNGVTPAAAADEPHVVADAGGGKPKRRRSAGGGLRPIAAPAKPGPLARLKPSANCVPIADGTLAVVRRPIAADHSCLFNSVGYAMHQSKSRAPFLRRVVSNEVSGDPDTWNAAFLGMPNAAYCAWINEPQNWGGGIELGARGLRKAGGGEGEGCRARRWRRAGEARSRPPRPA